MPLDNGQDERRGLRRLRRRRGGGLRPRRRVLRSVVVLPTLLTLGNAICGFLAIFFASRPAETKLPFDWDPISFGAIFIFLGMIFDGLDGRVARLTRQTSDLGEQLDSMADMVTFGVAPAFIVVQLIGVGTPFASDTLNDLYNRAALVIAVLFVACAALRLARYNVELKSGTAPDPFTFKGLPAPGAAGAVASLVLLSRLDTGLGGDTTVPAGAEGPFQSGLLAVMLLVSFAMVSRLPYVHVLNKYVRGRVRFGYLARIVVLGALVAIWPTPVLAVVFTAYALSAPTIRLLRLAGWIKPAPLIPAPASAAASPEGQAGGEPAAPAAEAGQHAEGEATAPAEPQPEATSGPSLQPREPLPPLSPRERGRG